MCYARHYGDQMACGPCGLNWDANDPDPPKCRKVDKRSHIVKQLAPVAVKKAAPSLPTVLPDSVAADMEKAARNGGMQAAYRVLLDSLDF